MLKKSIVWTVLAAVILSAASFPAPVGATNPKLAVKVTEVTAREAASALAKAAGVPVELQLPALPAGTPLPTQYRVLDEKSTFDWNGKSFAAALRELVVRYRLAPSRSRGGYLLFAGGASRPTPPMTRVARIEQSGIALSVRRVSIRSNRTLEFSGAVAPQDEQVVSLEIQAELGQGDSDTIAGIENVVAMDDRGNLLTQDRRAVRATGAGLLGSLYPDEWACSVSLTGAHPGASRLVWVEGELVTYGTARVHQLEFPLPLATDGSKRVVGDTTVEVVRANIPTGPTTGNSGRQASIVVQIQAPLDSALANAGQDVLPVPDLIGQSGAVYSATRSTRTGRRLGAGTTFEINAEFASLSEAPRAIRLVMPERKDPRVQFAFRMAEVPLPAAGTFIARQVLPVANRSNPDAARAYFQQGGGTLVTSIRINDQPAPDGVLAIGLVPKGVPVNAGVRWIDAAVGKDGTVRVMDVKPGKYRVLRTFLPKQDLRLVGGGRWFNNEVEVIVESGEESGLLPLEWKMGTSKEGDSAENPTNVKPPAQDGTKPAMKPAVKKAIIKKPNAKKPNGKKPAPRRRK